MAALNKREKMLIVVGLPAVLIWAAWLILAPSPGAANQKGQLSAADADKKTHDLELQNKVMIKEQDEMAPKIAQMSYTIPAEQLVPRVIRDLQSIAAKSGVHLREIKPIRGKKLKSNAGVRVPIEVRFNSKLQPDAVHFLYHIEEADSRMVVDKINITSADPRFKTVDVSATITVFTTSLDGFSGGEGDNSNATNRSTRG